jgi:hypothetical protein
VLVVWIRVLGLKVPAALKRCVGLDPDLPWLCVGAPA